jgi:aromatic ring hydroxylase
MQSVVTGLAISLFSENRTDMLDIQALFDVSGKVALITGATGGFGKAAAKECVITENGIAYPNPLLCNMGKYLFASGYHTAMRSLQEIAGGLPAQGRPRQTA